MTDTASGDSMTGDQRAETAGPVKCVSCGKFVGYDEMTDGSASFYFEPDNHFGPEVSEWTCKRCVAEGK